MRYLVFSDLHFFRGRQYLIDTCHWIADQISDHKPDRVVFCGDLNHSHNFVETDTLHDMTTAIAVVARRAAAATGEKLIAVSGNHDTALRSGGKNVIEAIAALTDDVHAVSEPWTDGTALYVPHPPQDPDEYELFKRKVSALDREQHIMFSHLELADIRYTPVSKHTSEKPFPIPSHITMVVNGHYHHPEVYRHATCEVVIVGSPCYHSYADILTDTPRGCMLVDSEQIGGVASYKVTRLENPHGPIYHTIVPTQIPAVLDHAQVSRMMLRVQISSTSEYDAIKPAISVLREKARSVRVIGKNPEVAATVYKAEDATISAVDPTNLLRDYCKSKDIAPEMAAYGMAILAKVSKS